MKPKDNLDIHVNEMQCKNDLTRIMICIKKIDFKPNKQNFTIYKQKHRIGDDLIF